MSSTNKTVTIELSQYVGTDKPTYLTDYNGDMLKIDNAIAQDRADIATAQNKADQADGKADTVADAVASLSDEINNASNGIAKRVTDTEGDINTIQSLIGNGTPTTQDKTIIGAINELAAEIPGPSGPVDADDVSYDNTTSGMTATNVQAAIDEIHAALPGPASPVEADDVSYSNTSSGLTATNVQAAIDELAQGGTQKTPVKALSFTTAGTGTALSKSIANHDFVILYIEGTNDNTVYGSVTIPVALFRTYAKVRCEYITTSSGSAELNYADITYVDDTHVTTAVSNHLASNHFNGQVVLY